MTQDLATTFVDNAPTSQNIIDIFDGEWSSKMPAGSNILANPGHAALFQDGRIHWAEQVLGRFAEQRILELGPLEAAHSYMLHQAGAAEVVAVEANARAFLKCLCIKEVFDLSRVKFQLGDFIKYLENEPGQVDAVIASGVLYHMVEPVRLIELLAKTTDRVMIWTHYFDQDIIAANEALAPKFSPPKSAKHDEFEYRCSQQDYQRALNWKGFSGGTSGGSLWLELDSIREALNHYGLTRQTENFHQPNHPNGPAIAICAQR